MEPVLNAVIVRHQLDSEVMATLGAIVPVISLKVRVFFLTGIMSELLAARNSQSYPASYFA